MKPPIVSVVIPACNHEQYVGEAIQSVLDQSFTDFELIVINDGSTDHTEEEILKFQDSRIRYYAQENRGLSVTLNRGVELARGDYFNFLPSDDAFYCEKLEVQLRAFEQDPDLGVLFAYPRIVDAGGREIEDKAVSGWPIVPFETKEEIFPALFERNFLSAPTALIKTDCLRKVGGFDPFLRYAQDYDLWMRILKFYGARLLKQPLVRYRWHGINQTYQATPEIELERAKILLKAYKELDLCDVFPSLRFEKDSRLHARAWRTLANYVAKSGLPALEPIRFLYEEKARSLESSGFPLAAVREARDERWSSTGTLSSPHPRVHVLLETPSFDRGGLEQVVFDLATGLRPELFQAVVVVERGGALAQRCKERGIPVEVLRYDKAEEYRTILERYAIDVVLSHYSTFGTRLAFEKGIPVLSVLHNIYSWFPEALLSEFRSVDPFVSRYVAVSDEVKEYAKFRFNIPGEKIVVIPNGMDIKAYRSRPPGPPVTRSDLGWRDEDYVFVNVAAISPPKGQNVILAALHQIVKEDPSIRVLSVGNVLDKGYFQFLQKSVEEFGLSKHFRFIGFAEDVRPYLETADAFLLTSFIEGWPLSVMEGMLHRLPVLSTRVSGVSALLGESGGGLIVENSYEDYRFLKESSIDGYSKDLSPGHANDVARGMIRFARERASWKEAGLRGYERIVTHFDLRRTLPSYEGELLTLFTTREWRRRQRLLTLHHEKEEALRQEQKLLQQKERTVDDLKRQLAYEKEVVEARIQQLESNLRLLQDRIDKRFDTLLIRLSLSERMKGLVYRLMKKVHLLVPVPLREKYRARYQEVFFDKVTPADQRVPAPSGDALATREGGEAVRAPGGTLQQEFLRFKEAITRGLPVELERFHADQVRGRVSVVLPVHNQAQYVGQAIESVLRQTYGQLELIVVDDGSSDGTARVLDPYRGDPRITVIEQTNLKLPRALSKGFRHATGEFYTWTSADNLMDERHLEVLVEFLTSHPNVQMVYANYDLIDEDGNPLLNADYCPGYQQPPQSNHIHLPRDPLELNVIRNNYVGPCFLYRGWVGRLVGDYDPFMFTLEDYDYWMTINTFFRIEHLGRDDPLYFNRVHLDSLTGRKTELKIVENTDRLMEFERERREFYRKAFHVYLIGNHDRLLSVKRGYLAHGQKVESLGIPCESTTMAGEKNIGIWIYSGIEKGFMTRIMEENPEAFYAMVLLDRSDLPEKEFCARFPMIVSLSGERSEEGPGRGWFYGDTISTALYPILCKANIDLFRGRKRFQREVS